MSKTVRPTSLNNLKSGHAYSIGEYSQVLVKLGLFSSHYGFIKWHYESKKESWYADLFFKPLGVRGNDKIQSKNIKYIVRFLRGEL